MSKNYIKCMFLNSFKFKTFSQQKCTYWKYIMLYNWIYWIVIYNVIITKCTKKMIYECIQNLFYAMQKTSYNSFVPKNLTKSYSKISTFECQKISATYCYCSFCQLFILSVTCYYFQNACLPMCRKIFCKFLSSYCVI